MYQTPAYCATCCGAIQTKKSRSAEWWFLLFACMRSIWHHAHDCDKCASKYYSHTTKLYFGSNSQDWGENDRGVSFTFGADVVSRFLRMHDLELICRGHQVKWGFFSQFWQICRIFRMNSTDLAPSFRLFRWLKMATSSSPSGSWSPCSRHRTTAASSTMLAVWWRWTNHYCARSR